MSEVDFIQLAPGVGKHFLGEPSKVYSNEWRWGTNGSWCLTLDTGLFYSFELDDGGGVLWLIDHFNGDRSLVLNQLTNTKPMAKAKTFTSTQMKKLAIESIVLLIVVLCTRQFKAQGPPRSLSLTSRKIRHALTPLND